MKTISKRAVPLILPSIDEDGAEDWLYDIVATAEYLGVAVSTIRNHQYDPRDNSWPAPESEDRVLALLNISSDALPGVSELLRRAGGNGIACRMWLRKKLSDFRSGLAVRTEAPKSVAAPVVVDGDVEKSAVSFDKYLNENEQWVNGHGEVVLTSEAQGDAFEGKAAVEQLSAREVLARARERREAMAAGSWEE